QDLPPLVAAVTAQIEERAEPGQRWSFARTLARGEERFTAAYDPSRPAGERWTLVEPASVDQLTEEQRTAFEGFAMEEAPDLDIVLGDQADEEGSLKDLLGENFTLVSDDGSRAVFTFTPSGAAEGGGPAAMAEHLAGELILDSAVPMVTVVRYF